MKFFKDIFTGKDNATYDGGRVLCAASFIVYFIFTAITLAHGTPFDYLSFSGGISAMAVGFGLNLKFKRDTEPS